MSRERIETSIANATKWSSLAEIAAKLILPIVNMILARLLTPQAFGVVATVNIVITFAGLFEDAGFQKFIIQHEFDSKEEFNESANVTFWTNLLLSFIIFIIIFLFQKPISLFIGGISMEKEIVVASISLPIFAISSIQIAHYKRNFEFKKLFWVRIITSLIPLIITVPLAIIFRNHWALIIGTVVRNVVQAIVLFVGTSWKPKFKYSVNALLMMLPFCIWTLAESISIWFTGNVSTFIVTKILGTEMVGYYKTSMSTVTSVTSIVSSATIAVLFAALSRVQNEEKRFNAIFYDYQRIVGIFVIPLGAGMWLYSDLYTQILLGKQWLNCSWFIGIYSLAMSIAIITNSFFSELYRAKGKPKISMLAQLVYLSFLIPVTIISAKQGFDQLCVSTTVAMMGFTIVHFAIISLYFKIEVLPMIKSIFYISLPTGGMVCISLILKSISVSVVWQMISILICIIVYFVLLISVKPLRLSLQNSDLTSGIYRIIIRKIHGE